MCELVAVQCVVQEVDNILNHLESLRLFPQCRPSIYFDNVGFIHFIKKTALPRALEVFHLTSTK